MLWFLLKPALVFLVEAVDTKTGGKGKYKEAFAVLVGDVISFHKDDMEGKEKDKWTICFFKLVQEVDESDLDHILVRSGKF